MPRFEVNATVSMSAWLEVDADDEDEALLIARGTYASAWGYDTATASLEFNVTPEVELLA